MNFKTEQLTVGYNGAPLVKEINISLEAGQILTLVGPNGSGKSTVLKSIAKQLAPLGGTVYLGDSAIDKMSGAALAKELAAMFTDRLKQEHTTCYDIAAAGRYPYTGTLGILGENDRKKIKEAMELTDVWGLRERDFTQISDGQRSRVLLARALCQEPKIILLDEPTSFLDVKYVYELLQALKTLARQRGVTIITALHQVRAAKQISDLIMCVKGEYVFKTGAPEDVLKKETICQLYGLTDEGYNFMFGEFL